MATIVTRAAKGSPLTSAELDQNQINLNTDKAELSGATFTGAITANAGVVVDQLTIDGGNITSSSGGMTISGADDITVDAVGDVILSCDGDQVKFDDGTSTRFTFNLDSTPTMGMGTLTLFENEIDVSSGNLTLDVAGDIILDADGDNIFYKAGGDSFYSISNVSGNTYLGVEQANKDLVIRGSDGGVAITALTLDMSAAGAATFNSSINASGISQFADVNIPDNNAIRFGNGQDLQIYHDGTNSHVDNNTGNLTLNVAGNIILDADGGEIEFKDGGTTFGNIAKSSNDMRINQGIQDGDIVFRGNDGGSIITALTLDMSNAGAATFNAGINIPDFIYHTSDAHTYFGFQGGDQFELETGGANRMSVVGSETVFNDDGGDKDFRVESNNSTHALFVDGGTNRVGIGKSDPARTLDVHGSVEFSVNTASHETFIFTTQAVNDAKLLMQNASAATAIQLSANGDTFFKGGNVGIGTTPSNKLDIKGTVGFEATNSTNKWLAYHYTDNTFRLNYNGAGSDELVIDSNGAATFADDVIADAFLPTAAGAYGSNHVGVHSSGVVLNAATSQTGYIMSAGSAVMTFAPTGGTIQLGGLTAANKLDDYEEGEYDCSVTCGTSGTITLNGSFNRAAYTKVGRLVTVHGFLVVSSVSSPVGFFNVTLPFTPASLTDRAGDSVVSLVIQNVASANISDFVGTINENDARIYIQLGDSNTVQNDSAQQVAANTYVHFSATYSTA